MQQSKSCLVRWPTWSVLALLCAGCIPPIRTHVTDATALTGRELRRDETRQVRSIDAHLDQGTLLVQLSDTTQCRTVIASELQREETVERSVDDNIGAQIANVLVAVALLTTGAVIHARAQSGCAIEELHGAPPGQPGQDVVTRRACTKSELAEHARSGRLSGIVLGATATIPLGAFALNAIRASRDVRTSLSTLDTDATDWRDCGPPTPVSDAEVHALRGDVEVRARTDESGSVRISLEALAASFAIDDRVHIRTRDSVRLLIEEHVHISGAYTGDSSSP